MNNVKQKWRGGQSGTYQRLTIGVVGSAGERREGIEMKRKSEKKKNNNWSFQTKTLCSSADEEHGVFVQKLQLLYFFFTFSFHLYVMGGSPGELSEDLVT